MQRLWLSFVASVLALVLSFSFVLARESNPVWKAGRDGVAGDMEVLAARGEALFNTRGCIACHAVRGTGSTLGPDLSQVGTARDVRWLKRWLRETHEVMPGSRMPQIWLEPEEIDALTVYLSGLQD